MRTELELSEPKPPPKVAIEPKELIPTDQETEAAMIELCMSKLSPKKLIAFSKIGHKIEGAGVIRTQRGAAFVSQHRLNTAIEEITKMLFAEGGETKPTPEQACAIVHAIAYATDKLTAVQRLIIDSEARPTASPAVPPMHNNPFPAATAVVAQSGATVHLHQPPQKSVAEPKPHS